MRCLLLASTFLVCFASIISATALTFKLVPNEKSCFFTYVDQKAAKVAFYFAVQSGGSFDVDYSVVGPNEKVIMEGAKERQGDFVFTANEIGEYRFCFNNEMSTFADKMVDFEIAVRCSSLNPPRPYHQPPTRPPTPCVYPTAPPARCPPLQVHANVPFPTQVENEARAQLPSRQGTSPEQTSALEESLFKLSGQLSTINRNQKYFRTRENRNFSTVRSTETRIWNFSLIESVMMVGMAGLQVFVVRFFFQGARK
ncbi:hypothetical protein LTR60_005188, partial [Cryomyces antarcticus]